MNDMKIYITMNIFLLSIFTSFGGALSQVEMSIKDFHTYTNKDLYAIINNNDMQDIKLQVLTPEMNPSDWAADRVYREIVRMAWISYGIVEDPKTDTNMTDIASRIPQQAALDCLIKTAAFDELCQRADEYAALCLLNRSQSESTLLDICIAGKIVWGDLLPIIPNNRNVVFDFEEHPYPSEKWCFQNVDNNFWQQLYDGNNEVYRMLAVDCFDTWADHYAREEFEQNGWKFSNPQISMKWLQFIEVLSPADRIKIYNRVINERLKLSGQEEGNRKWQEHFNRLIKWNIEHAEEQQMNDARIIKQKSSVRFDDY